MEGGVFPSRGERTRLHPLFFGQDEAGWGELAGGWRGGDEASPETSRSGTAVGRTRLPPARLWGRWDGGGGDTADPLPTRSCSPPDLADTEQGGQPPSIQTPARGRGG